MLEKLFALFEEGITALKSIAKSLEGAALAAVSSSPAPTAAADAAPPVHTIESIKALATSTVATHGRPAVRDVMKASGFESMKDIKPEHFEKFHAGLTKLASAPPPSDDGL